VNVLILSSPCKCTAKLGCAAVVEQDDKDVLSTAHHRDRFRPSTARWSCAFLIDDRPGTFSFLASP